MSAEESNSSKGGMYYYFVPLFVGMVIFSNHYARDTVGALERQLEEDLNITPIQYSTMAGLFFIPNMITPLFMSFLVAHFGGPTNAFAALVAVSAFGYILFASGAELNSLATMYLARVISGSVYELIDCVPVLFLSPVFKSSWSLMVGLLNAFLRLGSVFCFLVNPVVYSSLGIKGALWVSSFIAVSGVIFVVGCGICANELGRRGIGEVGNEEFDNRKKNQQRRSGSKDTYNIQNNNNKNNNEHTLTPEDGDDDHATIRVNFAEENDDFRSNVSTSDNLQHSVISMKDLDASRDADNNGGGSGNGNYYNKSTDYKIGASSHGLLARAGGSSEDDRSSRNQGNATAKDTANNKDFSSSSVLYFVLEYMPFHLLDMRCWYFIVCGGFLYGAIVPFWFMGSKFMQINYAMTVGEADTLMILPEGAIVIVSPVVGLFLMRYHFSYRTLMMALCIASCGLALGYFCLAQGFILYHSSTTTTTAAASDGTGSSMNYNGDTDDREVTISPIGSMLLVGISFATANTLLWTNVIKAVRAPSQMAAVTGLNACVLNLLPAMMPFFITAANADDPNNSLKSVSTGEVVYQSSSGMYLLTSCALLSAGFAFLSAEEEFIYDTEEEGNGANEVNKAKRSDLHDDCGTAL